MSLDQTLDMSLTDLKSINKTFQNAVNKKNETFLVVNPMGAHSLAVGIEVSINIRIDGHVGYYCGGMNENANITINGNAGVGVAENMMGGSIIVKGNASQSAGASAHGGLLVIEGNASSRCGISMKGINIVVKGSVGHNSAFMAQSGNLVICGDADDGLGDSIYETKIFLKGKIKNLGSDCVEKEMKDEHIKILSKLLIDSGINESPYNFRRYGSGRKLYNFDVKNIDAY